MTRAKAVRFLVTTTALIALLSWASRDSKSGWGLLIAFLAYVLGQTDEWWRQELRK